MPGGYCKAWHKRQWLEAMQASMESTERSQGSIALKIRNAGPGIDTFVTQMGDDPSQRGIKRKVLLWRVGCIPGLSQM